MPDRAVESISVQVPVDARLYVHVDHDSVAPRPATYADVEQFHLERRFGAYHRACDMLRNHLTEQGLIPGDLTVARVNPLCALFETASYPEHVHEDEDWREVLEEIAVIERCLQRHLDAFIAEESAKETLDDYPRE